jgi:hypothetical protein
MDAVNRPIKGAISRLFGRPFQLTLGKRVLTFSNPTDFEFALGGRVSVSLVKVVELLHRPASSLRRETVAIRLIEQNLLRVVDHCLLKPDHIGALLHDIGIRGFSTDYRWRAIFESLAEGGAELNAYRHVAVSKYLQYLCARRDALGIVYYHKTGKALEDEIVVDAPLPEASNDVADQTIPPGRRPLPHGKPVVVAMDSTRDLPLFLAEHELILRVADGMLLIDEQGRPHRLSNRQHTIGRALGNDITLDGDTASVSRKHLIIEPLSGNRVRLTDLSARGTFIPMNVAIEASPSAAAA